MQQVVPTVNNVQQIFEGLCGDEAEVTQGEMLSAENALAAMYINNDGAPVGVVLFDMPFAAYAGAYLSLVPKEGAQDVVDDGVLFSPIKENVNEVMNICSRLLMDEHTPHIRFKQVFEKASQLPAEAKNVLDNGPGRGSFMVKIPGYGNGRLSVIVN